MLKGGSKTCCGTGMRFYSSPELATLMVRRRFRAVSNQ
jgi:hypothetical protein